MTLRPPAGTYRPPDLEADPHFTRRTRARIGRGGFTLLEMVLAAAILVIISMTVYQFTSITMQTTEFSLRDSENTLACGGLRRLLEAQLASLPANQNGALIGMQIDRKGGDAATRCNSFARRATRS